MITITIETNSAAFEDDENEELARIFRKLVIDIYARGQFGLKNKKLHDINGNTVGRVVIT
jgi:hypothetical protein